MMFIWIALLFFSTCDGKISIHNEATTQIDGHTNGFKIAEGVAFSPTGHCLAVAWAKDNAIALYKKAGESHYHTEPSCVLQDPQLLGFAHDLAFSACGRYLAVASREVHKIVLYKMDNSAECRLHSEPCCVIETPASYPSSLSFSRDGKSLAVCNRMGGRGISLYRVLEEGMEASPYLEITEAKLLEYGLSAPHGIAFLPDCQSIAVVHKQFYKNPQAEGNSALAIIDLNTEAPICIDFYDSEIALHSVDCHPTGHYLVVVDELSMVALYERVEKNQFRRTGDFPQSIQGGTERGARGVAFSCHGKCLAVSTREPCVTVYSVNIE